jgi:hypothetical protein
MDSARENYRRQLITSKRGGFRLRMSNLGRPPCMLQAEAEGHAAEQEAPSNRFRNLYGDLIESAAIGLMKEAGVNVKDEQIPCELELAGTVIDGTADIVIDEEGPKVYDIKSSSSWAYTNKYVSNTLHNLWEDGDSFGYVTQIYLYSQSLKLPVGGLIIINKETGEWYVMPPPIYDDELRAQSLKRAEENVIRHLEKQPFKKDFEPVQEVFRGKPTGNEILPVTCTFCRFKNSCWPGVQHRPQVVSKGQSPRWYYYTKITGE